MRIIITFFLGVVIVTAGVIGVSYLQYRFDRSDLKHAVEALRHARPSGPSGETVEERITRVYGVNAEAIQWIPKIESKTQGTVWVEVVLPGQDTNLLWQVDLVRFNVAPVSPAAKSLGQDPSR